MFDTRGLAGTPESLILRLQPAIYLGRDAIAEGPDVPRYPRPLCVAEHHGRIARESTRIESRIRPADVPNSSVEARVALRGPGRRSTGGLFESTRSISDRARRGRGRRSAALKQHQQGDCAGEDQVRAQHTVADATEQATDQPTSDKARERGLRRITHVSASGAASAPRTGRRSSVSGRPAP